jgi:glycosyltransferase involved in cell wall biosynthesis
MIKKKKSAFYSLKGSLVKRKTIFFLANTQSIHTVKWIDYFVDKNYNVHVATFSNINNTKCKQVHFLGKSVNVSGGNYHYLLAIGKLAKLLVQIKPDYINAHYSYSMGLIALLAKQKSRMDCSFSVVCHGSDVLSPPKPYVFDLINKYILRGSDHIFAVSDQIRDKVIKMGIDANKIFVGQYGIDTQQFVSKTPKNIDILSNRAYVENSRIDLLLDVLDKPKYYHLNIVFVLPNIEKQKLEYPLF